MDVVGRGVKLDASESGDCFNLREMSMNQFVPRMPTESSNTLGAAAVISERYRVPMEVIFEDQGLWIIESGKRRDEIKQNFVPSLSIDGTQWLSPAVLHQPTLLSPSPTRYVDRRSKRRLTSRNSLEYSTEFHLNSFFDKELYYFMSQNNL